MKKPYETCVVFDGSLTDDVVEKEQQQVETFLKENADLEKVHAWGRRKLAYEVKKKTSGMYFLFQYQADADISTKLERQFKLNQNVLRYLTVRRNPNQEIVQPVAEVQIEEPVAVESAEIVESAETVEKTEEKGEK